MRCQVCTQIDARGKGELFQKERSDSDRWKVAALAPDLRVTQSQLIVNGSRWPLALL